MAPVQRDPNEGLKESYRVLEDKLRKWGKHVELLERNLVQKREFMKGDCHNIEKRRSILQEKCGYYAEIFGMQG